MLKSIIGAIVGNRVGRGNNGLLGAGLGIAATRIATRSIPGALLVGGAFVAKKLYDKRRAGRIGGASSTKQLPVGDSTPNA